MKVVEIFHSLQGEGVQIGLPTVFIRLAGCNLRCTWCDTKYAYEGGEDMPLYEVVKRIKDMGGKRLCITGGEPLMQQEVFSLLRAMKDHEILLETNGSIDISSVLDIPNLQISLDVKCPSSGMSQHNRRQNLALLRPRDQIKFVIADEADYKFAKDIIRLKRPCPVIFQSVAGTSIKDLAERVLADQLEVRVLPQLHKIIWPDEERGR